jgi:hypothetical protein
VEEVGAGVDELFEEEEVVAIDGAVIIDYSPFVRFIGVKEIYFADHGNAALVDVVREEDRVGVHLDGHFPEQQQFALPRVYLLEDGRFQ